MIRTFEELKEYSLYDCDQFWYYVILLNPRDLSPAGQSVFENMKIFHLDSGDECQYFIPGFLNTGRGLFTNILSFFKTEYSIIRIPNFGDVQFNDQYFVEFYKELEKRNNVGWRYSGECELLLFNLSMGNKIKLNNFVSYNLDDIARNKRSISEFIRLTINVGKDAKDQDSAKHILDEKFYELIIPDSEKLLTSVYEKGWDTLCHRGFRDDAYLFISYSSKDFRMVSEIRNRLLAANISCWMAPFDIPPGSNYALIIEHAIKHAQKFVLMLSKSAVNSVWVGKELKRAIARFQVESSERICIVWLNGFFKLEDTPLALPLEDIQISIDLMNNPNNYYLLLSKEKQKEIDNQKKINKYRAEIVDYLAPSRMTKDLREVLSRIRAINAINSQMIEENEHFIELSERINEEINWMEGETDIRSESFNLHYAQAICYLNEIKKYLDY
jgi:hypothetical protein